MQYTNKGTVKGEQIFGSVAVYESGGFVVDKTLPVIQINGVTEGQTSKTVTITYSATDSFLQSVTATLEKDGGAPASFASGSTVSVTGQYILKVLAVDTSGNTAEQTRNFTIDSSVPAITLTSPADGS